MNLSLKKENRIYLPVLLGCLLCLFLSVLSYVIIFDRSTVLGLGVNSRVSGTRTAIALTSGALLGPFPTGTRPTSTASKTPTITPTPTLTPTNTPTRTPRRFFIDTATPRASVPGDDSPPVAAPTNPPVQPTNPPPPVVQPTNPPAQPTVCVNPQGHPIPCKKN